MVLQRARRSLLPPAWFRRLQRTTMAALIGRLIRFADQRPNFRIQAGVEMTRRSERLSVRPFQHGEREALQRLWARVFPDDPPWNAPEVMIENKLKVQPELLLVVKV